ncbi:MAG TPA: hypothetical protein VM733_20635 [Thermoanaerobaculia bacterium]|nr:hypothetical protein [Thermoanaerobaculia bacterium]
MTSFRRLAVAAAVLASSAAYAHSSLDLAASLRLPPFLRAGQTERVEVVADVQAFDPAEGVTLTIDIDAGTFANAGASSQWRCTREAKRVRCAAEEAAQGPHVIALDVTTPASGSVTFTASITSIASFDPYEANNRAQGTSRIYSPSACTAAAPVLGNASTDGNTTELTWSAVPGATSYEVFAAVNGEKARRITTTNNTSTVSRLLGGGDVTWSVVANFANCPAVTSDSATFASTGTAALLRVATIRSDLFLEPVAVAIDARDQSIMIADAARHRLFAYETIRGNVFDLPLARESGTPAISYDGGITVGPGRIAYVAERTNHLLRYTNVIDNYFVVAAGTAGSPGSNDGTGRAARLRAPLGVAVDAQSRIFVADTGNNSIRRTAYDVSKVDFVTTTLVGAAAGLSEPAGIAIDADGNLVVADSGNHVIRRVSASGAVTTLAGVIGHRGHRDGDAAQALFDHPHGVAVDPWGNVYVSEEGNHTVRRITPNGRVTTVAGRPGVAGDADGVGDGAQFNRPGLIAIDEKGVLWIADRGNATLRRAEPGVPLPKRRASRP